MEKILADLLFLKENKYISVHEYTQIKDKVIEKDMSNQDYFESLSCWMIEGLISKSDYLTYIKEIWGIDLSYKNNTYLNIQRPIIYYNDERISIISVVLFIFTVIIVLWLKSIVIK